ncbi:MAG: DUF975 family protein [Dorea sp.]
MWTRTDLKERAKIAFKRNYWRCVLVAFVLSIFTSAGSSVSTNLANNLGSPYDSSEEYLDEDYYDNEDIFGYEYSGDDYSDGGLGEVIGEIVGDTASTVFVLFGTVIVLIVAIVAAILGIFVFAPLEVGGCRFFTENSSTAASSKNIFYAYQKGRYLKIVGTLFLRNLYTALWTLLFIVPGIIKSLEYRMVPYLLADDPDMPREDAFRISKEMMDGNKMDAFILDLSFIGWALLGAITCGIAGIFYVTPYIKATDAELFITLRANYFQKQQFQNQGF